MGKTSEAAAEQKQVWWDKPGPGRSQCKHCKKYIGTARHVCPHCETAVKDEKPSPSRNMLAAMKFANELRQFVNGQKGKNESERLETMEKLIDQIAGFLATAGGTDELKEACRLAMGQPEAGQAA